MTPAGYNQNVQVTQTEDYVLLLNEMVHSSRVIPLDGRPHLPDGVRQWMGDSRGHWEGDTLVVDTTNFLRETSFRAGVTTSDLHLIERFTRVSDGTLLYEVTVEDPNTWARMPGRGRGPTEFRWCRASSHYSSMPVTKATTASITSSPGLASRKRRPKRARRGKRCG